MKKKQITIIDYGMGNIGSIVNMLDYLGFSAVIAREAGQLIGGAAFILPGVGSFDRAVTNLHKSGMFQALKEIVADDRTPLLGICLGMQLMCRSSEEGNEKGLGLIDAQVRRFYLPANSTLKVPHMGWTDVSVKKKGTVLRGNDIEIPRYYFVHSFYVSCANDEDVIGTSVFHKEFVSAFQHKNLIGVQFHPEKSHKFGINLFKNFLGLIE
jgi:glutamine amidotransferase